MISGLFHKWHVDTSVGAVTVDICHQCQQEKAMKDTTEKTGGDPENAVSHEARVGKGNRKVKHFSQRAKLQPHNYKKGLAKRRFVKLHGLRATISKKWVQSMKGKPDALQLPLRRSARQAAKYVAVHTKTHKGNKKGKQKKSKKRAPKRQENKASYRKQRTQAFCSYWFNGLHLSRLEDDKRVTMFRKKSTFSPYSTGARRDKVKCSLCGEGGRTSKSTYIACETCSGKRLSLQSWFWASIVSSLADMLSDESSKMLLLSTKLNKQKHDTFPHESREN